jgi:3-hydroxybutyryl-CoA dehydrogenase
MDTIGIIGAGTMWNGIAYVAASHGHDVVMYDVQLALAQRGLEAVRVTLQRHVEKKRIDQTEMQATLDRIQLTTDLDDMASAALVIEAVPEDLALKRDIFHSLDHICIPEVLLCSNTSSLSITALAGATERPGQVAGLHFFNPAPMMALVEVVGRSDI